MISPEKGARIGGIAAGIILFVGTAARYIAENGVSPRDLLALGIFAIMVVVLGFGTVMIISRLFRVG